MTLKTSKTNKHKLLKNNATLALKNNTKKQIK